MQGVQDRLSGRAVLGLQLLLGRRFPLRLEIFSVLAGAVFLLCLGSIFFLKFPLLFFIREERRIIFNGN